jgi:hypothetical protein
MWPLAPVVNRGFQWKFVLSWQPQGWAMLLCSLLQLTSFLWQMLTNISVPHNHSLENMSVLHQSIWSHELYQKQCSFDLCVTHIEEVGEVWEVTISALPALERSQFGVLYENPHACQCPGVPTSGPISAQISQNPWSVGSSPAFFSPFWWWSTSGCHPKKYLAPMETIENQAKKTWLKTRNLFTSGELFLEV